VTPVGFGRSGIHGDFYFRAAIQSMRGIVANDAEEAMYMAVTQDQHGGEINSSNTYEIHFEPGQTPPAKDFWSLTIYDQDANLMLNPYDRYAINSHSKDLIYEADGSLRIFTLRAYGPEKAMLERTWQPPAVKRL